MPLAFRGKRIGKKGAEKAPFLLNDNMGNYLSFPFSFPWCLYPLGYPLATLFFEHGFDNFQELVVFWGRTVVSTFHRTKIILETAVGRKKDA